MSLAMRIEYSLLFLLMLACGVPKKQIKGQEASVIVQSGVPILTFDTPEVDFGQLVKGEKRVYSFQFTNTGDVDLLIELATACTCTSLDWPRQPIPPGGRGSVDIVFDSASKHGLTSVDVDVIANTDPIVVTAVIKANVVDKEE